MPRGQLAQDTKLAAARDAAVFDRSMINVLRPVDPDAPGETAEADKPGG